MTGGPAHAVRRDGPPALSRGTHRRSDTDRPAAAEPSPEERTWSDPRCRVLAVADGQFSVVEGDDGTLLGLVEPASIPPEAPRFYLGETDAGPRWAAATPPLRRLGSRVVTLRDVGADLDDTGAGLATHAVALVNWHTAHPRCPRCGGLTVVANAGRNRRCPADGSEHFPRSDPAVIVLVTDDQDRVLLGRGREWQPGRYSVLAGFVEPGESAEQAVVREVFEESGVLVAKLEYRGSQPWPFPSSLMLAFAARAVGGQVRSDGAELAEVDWFTRDDVQDGARSGLLVVPGPVSVARRLIDSWLLR